MTLGILLGKIPICEIFLGCRIRIQKGDDMNMQKKVSEDKISQCGRSMLEILAVMLVIVVITVGAMYGYRDTVKQHEADRTYEKIVTEISYMNIKKKKNLF